MGETIGARIQSVIADTGLTAHAFAKRAGISDSAIRDFMHDRKLPGMKALAAISEVGDVMLDWLVLGTGVMRRKDALTVDFIQLLEEDASTLNDEEKIEIAKAIRVLTRFPDGIRQAAVKEFSDRMGERLELEMFRAGSKGKAQPPPDPPAQPKPRKKKAGK